MAQNKKRRDTAEMVTIRGRKKMALRRMLLVQIREIRFKRKILPVLQPVKGLKEKRNRRKRLRATCRRQRKNCL